MNSLFGGEKCFVYMIGVEKVFYIFINHNLEYKIHRYIDLSKKQL